MRNWSGNFSYNASRVHHPSTVDGVSKIVKSCNKTRALGTRHSFNSIADSAEDLISVAYLNRVVQLDRAAMTVTVEAGMKCGDVGEYLCREGYAMHNLASLPHISVGGAIATATHGSGDNNGNLATAVAALEVVIADGSVVQLSRKRHGEQFQGMVVALGGLGVVTKVTLDIVPAFKIRQDVYEDLAFSQLETHFEAIFSSAYSVSLFTDWKTDHINQVWLKSRVSDDAQPTPGAPQFFGALGATVERHPLPSKSGESCTPQLGVAGPSHERLPHFRMSHTPSSGQELQTEYFVTRQDALAALRAISQMRAEITPLLMISELRSIATDTLWMSPSYGRASIGIHFTWHPRWEAVEALLPKIEARLADFAIRPHWAKLFTMQPGRVQSAYTKLPDFRQLLNSYDPAGKFRNGYLEKYIVIPG